MSTSEDAIGQDLVKSYALLAYRTPPNQIGERVWLVANIPLSADSPAGGSVVVPYEQGTCPEDRTPYTFSLYGLTTSVGGLDLPQVRALPIMNNYCARTLRQLFT